MVKRSGQTDRKLADVRFDFGTNWTRYLRLVDEQRIAVAERSLREMLGVRSLDQRRFLDVGSGSGLFSLAARNLGATVHSFDYDSESVNCTQALKDRCRPEDPAWSIEIGDALDEAYLASLGSFDVVYSWGVLHHTGNMWCALANMVPLVKSGGHLYIALYNDQRWLSKYWLKVKQLYNHGIVGSMAVTAVYAPYFLTRRFLKHILKGKVTAKRRGMAAWRDIVDWLGGYPFEVASPDAVLAFYIKHGFTLERMTTVGGRHGCNEFVFRAPSKRL